MLGISLIFVGIALVHNGIMFMSKCSREKIGANGETVTELVPMMVASPKSIAFFNAIVGGILVLINLISLPSTLGALYPGGFGYNYMVFNNIAAGLLFGVTYLFIAGNFLFKLDMRPFGWYNLGVALFALVMSIYNFVQLGQLGDTSSEWFIHLLVLGILWLLWFVCWLAGALQFIFKVKAMEKFFPKISIVVGIVGAFIPAVLLLTGVWGLL